MRFAALHLRAYGPFSGTVLDLETGGARLQIVFGVNEAGKSSALRGVHDFLFGIPARTTDNFLHDNTALRVGAVLVGDDGKRNALMRRKGNKAVLFEFDEKNGEERSDHPVDQDRIVQLVPGVDEELFRMLFGLSHEALREGGRTLLKGEGDLGTTLFAAATGLNDVKGILQRLDDKARELFLSGGKTPKINTAIREYEISRKASRDALVRPQAWKELEANLLSARAEVDKLEFRYQELQASRAKKQRLRDLRPQAMQRHNLVQLLAELKDAIKLSEDARANVATARERAENARQQIAEAEEPAKNNQNIIATITVNKSYLDLAASIEAQHHAAAAARDGHQKLVTLTVALSEKHKEVARLLADIAPGTKIETADALLLGPAAALRLKALVRQLNQIIPARNAAQHTGEKATVRLQAADAALKEIVSPGDVAGLEAAIEAVQREGEPERSLKTVVAKVKSIEDDIRRRCAALEHDEAILVLLPLPQKASVEQFKKTLQGFEAKDAALEADVKKLRSDIAQRESDIKQLEATGNVVTAETLRAARIVRDRIWKGVRDAYVERSRPVEAIEKELALDRDLPEAYEQQVRSTDEQTDLFHADTERATKYAGYKDRIKTMSIELDRVAEQQVALGSARETDARAWSQVLKSLKLSSRVPEALLEWLRDHELAMKRIGDRDTAEAERQAIEAAITTGRETLNAAYDQASIATPKVPALAAFLVQARAQLKVAQDCEAKINALHKEKKTAERDIAAARAEVATLGARIEKLTNDAASDLEAISLSTTTTIDEIESRLDQLAPLDDALRDVRETQARINVSKALWDEFVRGMRELATQLDVESPEQPEQYLALATKLYDTLGANRKAKSRRESLETAIAIGKQKMGSETVKLEAAEKMVSDFVTLAKCKDADALEAAIDASERLRKAERELQTLDAGLRQFSKEEREDLLQAAVGEDPDALQAELNRMSTAIEDLEPQIKVARAAAAAAKGELDKIDGAALAVTARETMEHHAAAIQRDAGDYVRLRIAHALLGKAIRTYQDRSQGPLVTRASTWFSFITENRYMRLVVDYDGDDRVMLVERADGRRLGIAELSEGTADQLYLALRLAAIEGRLESSSSVPLILDDALLAFDDRRAVAALKAFVKLAKDNQVILFTHHAHIIELARRELLAHQYGTHELKLVALPS